MKPEDLPEEHRKYLDITDNPRKVTNTTILAMLSDGLTKIDNVDEKINGVKVDVAKIEVRSEERHGQQRREQSVIIAVVLATLGLVLWHLGIPIPLP